MPAVQRDPIHLGALEIRFLVEPGDSAGSLSVFECDIPAGARVPAPHSHDAFDETIYGVRGVTTWTVDGASTELGSGEAMHVARGQVHGFQNRHDEDATFLAIVTPALLQSARRFTASPLAVSRSAKNALSFVTKWVW